MQPVSIPPENKCIEVCGLEVGREIFRKFLSIEFRNADTLKEQIDFLKEHQPLLKVNEICKIFMISSRKYYKAIRGEAPFDNKLRKAPTSQLLTNEEETKIIDIIKQHQLDNDCLTGYEIREIASTLYKDRTSIERNFSRDWFRDFIRRHSSVIKKQKAQSLEEERSNISLNEVQRYIRDIEEMMANPPHPSLLLNFDETGFGRRPEKGKRKTVVVSKDCELAYWKERADLHHISVVSCISASCIALRPLLLSTRKHMDDDINNTFFERWGSYFYTPKGYMTQDSMVFWIKNI